MAEFNIQHQNDVIKAVKNRIPERHPVDFFSGSGHLRHSHMGLEIFGPVFSSADP